MTKLLYYVATDAPFGHHSGNGYDRDARDRNAHDSDGIYLVWLDDDDLAELLERTDGKVGYWAAGIPDNELDLETFMETWHQLMELRDDG